MCTSTDREMSPASASPAIMLFHWPLVTRSTSMANACRTTAASSLQNTTTQHPPTTCNCILYVLKLNTIVWRANNFSSTVTGFQSMTHLVFSLAVEGELVLGLACRYLVYSEPFVCGLRWANTWSNSLSQIGTKQKPMVYECMWWISAAGHIHIARILDNCCVPW